MAGCDLRMIVFEHSLHRARELFTTKFARGGYYLNSKYD